MVEGFVKDGYEAVRELFERNVETGRVSFIIVSLVVSTSWEIFTWQDYNAQLCVYVEGELVVDLWTNRDGFTGGRGRSVMMRAVTVLTLPGDSLLNIFSSSKSITALAMASLVSGGQVRYEDKISLHWPEFGAAGKADITLAQLMR